MKYVSAVVLLVLAIGLSYALKDYVFPTTWRYKITVEIDTPEGIKSGSAVREVRAYKNIARFLNPDVQDISYEVIGEAVVINLDGNRKLFGLINEYSYKDVFNAIYGGSCCFNFDDLSQIKLNEKAELKNDLPAFVIFSDENDPKSIIGAGISKMSIILGNGVAHKRTIIEITDEPISHNILKILPWLSKYYGHTGYLGGSQNPPFNDPTDTHVRLSNFIKGEK